ncbi:MAG: NAD(P)-dependent oxidoreductase [Chloroflexi bacterium]|nr:NAD(P)-dependent oxidoreductase [Chloroflexota bacterium]
MPSKLKVLITGASGYIASQMLVTYRDRYDLTLIDAINTDREGNPVAGVEIVDLIDTDRSKYEQYFANQDAIIHLAYKRSSPGGVYGSDVPHIDRFATELENVQMANNIYRCAYDAGVNRVVVASSNHAADWYEHALIHNRKKEMVFPEELPLSDNFYGWAKAAYELLAYPYACGAFGRKMEIVQVRIGNPRETNAAELLSHADNLHGGSGKSTYKRGLGAHFSQRDLRQLFTKAIETPDISNEHGVPWLIVYGISANSRAFWSLETARNVLGYEPEDDSELKFANDIVGHLTVADPAGPGKVGD